MGSVAPDDNFLARVALFIHFLALIASINHPRLTTSSSFYHLFTQRERTFYFIVWAMSSRKRPHEPLTSELPTNGINSSLQDIKLHNGNGSHGETNVDLPIIKYVSTSKVSVVKIFNWKLRESRRRIASIIQLVKNSNMARNSKHLNNHKLSIDNQSSFFTQAERY